MNRNISLEQSTIGALKFAAKFVFIEHIHPMLHSPASRQNFMPRI